ncbi:DUF1559 family PulG-like putative transporter [Limnoglobus roseus]|uniref:Prepilin-type cleavage/methylation domain-containing protein n=1 Tax=Limnoglobus roseus TaxID=2598579 RepID=A0A5C1A9D9_9BACT|nr:DUF1559 domain-containing protein [Limnoglobus roseus]QEL15155.1 prepilin-type cleavage/methylation domain-containing protein [Limnoglobus roseus]
MPTGVQRRNVIVLVGIAILTMGLVVTGIVAMRASANRAMCANNLKQLGIGFHGWHDTSGGLPPGFVTTPNGPNDWGPGWAWGSLLINYLESSDYYSRTKQNLPIEVVENKYSRTIPFRFFRCPTGSAPTTFMLYHRTANGDPLAPICDIAASNYVGVCGTTEPHVEGDGVLFRDSKVKFDDITNGLSNTLLVGERSFRTGESTWVGAVAGAGHFPPAGSGFAPELRDSANFVLGTAGGMTDGATKPKQANHFSSNHRDGVNFAMCDGSVRTLNKSISGDVLRAMATQAEKDNGGEN